ncbi:MAG: glycosyltransferase family 2 protein [Acidimicrobiales bacterium]
MPALNEQDTVRSVVTAVRSELACDVLVVDDGSSDRTAAEASAAGALVLQHPFNLGVGAALRSGFRVAAARGYRAAMQVDADGQHAPEDARRLLEPVQRGEADVVIGSRFAAGYQVGRSRRVAMRLLSKVVSRHLGVVVTDTTSGFRAFSADAIARFARSYPSAYLSDTVEALLLAGDWGLRVQEEAVRMRARQGGTPSAGGAMSVVYLARLLLVVLLHRVRRPALERLQEV